MFFGVQMFEIVAAEKQTFLQKVVRAVGFHQESDSGRFLAETKKGRCATGCCAV